MVIGGFTAEAAYKRDLRTVVPSEGVASNEVADRDVAIALTQRVLKASTPPTAEIDFAPLAAEGH